jgi:hypothetical protein
MVSVVISTRKIDDEYLKHVEKMFSHPNTEILMYENDGQMSLTQIYNKGLKESVNDIVVFMHDDLILETPNMTPKIVNLFDKSLISCIVVASSDCLRRGPNADNTAVIIMNFLDSSLLLDYNYSSN